MGMGVKVGPDSASGVDLISDKSSSSATGVGEMVAGSVDEGDSVMAVGCGSGVGEGDGPGVYGAGTVSSDFVSSGDGAGGVSDVCIGNVGFVFPHPAAPMESMISIKRIARILLLLNRVEVSCCSVIIVISFGSPEKNFTTETQSARRRK
ncbi:MAG: hypothetical protein DSY55_01405, partial [Clostridia bacterium]